MTAEEILAARDAGQLDDLLAGREPIQERGIGAAQEPRTERLEEPRPAAVESSADDRRPNSDRSLDDVSREHLYAMTPAEIMQAYEDGRLERLKKSKARDA